MNTFELMLYRSAVGFAVVALLVAAQPRAASPRCAAGTRGLHLVRNAFHYTGQNLWFFAVAQIPLGQLVALEFTNPIWVALLAPFLLGERLTPTRLLAARPRLRRRADRRPARASRRSSAGHFAALAAAVCFALNTIYTRQIMALRQRALRALLDDAAAGRRQPRCCRCPAASRCPAPPTCPGSLVVGLTGLTAHYALTSALGHAPASIVAPMEFVRLPVIALVGMLLYGEPLSLAVFVGAAVIIAGNLVNLRAETRRAPA